MSAPIQATEATENMTASGPFDAAKRAAVTEANMATTFAGLPSYSEMAEALRRLTDHTLHYASMPHAHSDAHKDAAQSRALLARVPQG